MPTLGAKHFLVELPFELLFDPVPAVVPRGAQAPRLAGTSHFVFSFDQELACGKFVAAVPFSASGPPGRGTPGQFETFLHLGFQAVVPPKLESSSDSLRASSSEVSLLQPSLLLDMVPDGQLEPLDISRFVH